MSGWPKLLAFSSVGEMGMRVFTKPDAYHLDAGIEGAFEGK